MMRQREEGEVHSGCERERVLVSTAAGTGSSTS